MSDSSQIIAGSLRDTVKNSTLRIFSWIWTNRVAIIEILSLIKDVEADYKIVQVDPASLRIIDACTSMHEIMDSGVYRTLIYRFKYIIYMVAGSAGDCDQGKAALPTDEQHLFHQSCQRIG